MPQADPDARPVTPRAVPARPAPASKLKHEEEAGQIDFSSRPAKAMTVWVENPDTVTRQGFTRLGAVETAIREWNEALGYEALQVIDQRDAADVRVRGTDKPMNKFVGETGEGKDFLLGRSTPGKPEILIWNDPEGESKQNYVWAPDTIKHELGHALGLRHRQDPKNAKKISRDPNYAMSYPDWQHPGRQGIPEKNVNPEEATQAWTNIANDVYGIPISPEAMRDILFAQGQEEGAQPGAPVEEILREWSARIYDGFASQIKAGVPPRALLDPFLQAASGMMGHNVRLTDPIMTNAFFSSNEEAKPSFPNMAQFLSRIRGSESWDDSPEADRMVNELIASMSQVPSSY